MNGYIGIDNGVTGSIGIILPDGVDFIPVKTLTKSEQDYVKKKRNITRIDHEKLEALFAELKDYELHVMIERPMVNPARFSASISAVRCLEAVQGRLEKLAIGFVFIDSREWQKRLLPKGISGGPQLKAASKHVGSRLWPQFADMFAKQKDADGMLIAEYCRLYYHVM